MNDFLKIIFGDQSLNSFAAYMVLAIIGIIIKLLWHVMQRNQASPNTPVDFSVKFMLTDNALRLLSSISLSMFVVFVCIRFCDDILHVALSPFIALLIGLGSDALSEQLKKLSATKTPFTTTSETITPEPPAGPAQVSPELPAAEQTKITPVDSVTQTVSQINS